MSPASARTALALDLVLATTLVLVPLALDPSIRSFTAAKVIVLQLLVGGALVLAGFAPRRPSPTARVLVMIVLGVLASIALRPDVEGLTAAGYLVACAALAWLLVERAPSWSRRRLAVVVAVPLGLDLGYSLLQCLGVGILDATRDAFGGVHGLAVGTVGNPTENTWVLLLAGLLLWRLVPGRRVGWVLAAVAVVVLVDRARATALVGGLVVAVIVLRSGPARHRVLAGLVVLVAVALPLAWGGAEALRGRGFLAAIGLRMLVQGGGLPQGPGTFARDFPASQARAQDHAPQHARFESRLDHAHLDPLELTHDFGLLAVLVLGLAAWAVVHMSRVDPSPARRAAGPTVLAGAALGLLGYPLYSPASAVVLMLALALALAPRLDVEHPPSWVRAIPTSALGIGLMVLSIHQLRGERLLTQALQARAEGDLERGRQLARRSAQWYPSADALFFVGNFELSRGATERAAAAYRRSQALRPRPEVRDNLELVTR